MRVREAVSADRTQVSAVLGRAFQVEPVYRWLFPDPRQRARVLTPLMHTFTWQMHHGNGTVEVAAVEGRAGIPLVAGAAVWDRPGAVALGGLQTLRALPGLLRATGRRMPKLAHLGEVLERARPDRPHWYLFHIGADPDRQAGGVGTALLRARLAVCDAERQPAYLECCDANVGYYRRFGFEVHDTVQIDAELFSRTMWREPGAVGAP